MNSEYWARRVRQMNQKAADLIGEEAQKELVKLYKHQAEQLYYKILNVFAKMQKDNAVDGKIYLNDLYRTNTFHVLLNYFNESARRLGGKQVKITQQKMLKAYQMAQDIVSKVEPDIGKMRPMYINPRTINPRQIIRQTWCLDGKNFSDRIWFNKNQLISDLSKHMQDNLSNGTTAYEISRALKEKFLVSQFKSYRLARTEVAHAAIIGQTNKFKEMGYTHGIFVASDPCGDCAENDGQRFTLDELQSMIPLHPNCRCSFVLDIQREQDGI